MLTIKLLCFFLIVTFCAADTEEDVYEFTFQVKDGNDWWQSAVIYQIYPRSFRDSNNDGIGDIKGIIEKLNDVKELSVTAIWISSIFKSPQVDQGYDITDYRDVDPIFGTLEDLTELIRKAHELEIKVILDFVPNHTSDQHQWFKDSVAKTEGYEDYYIWHNGSTDEGGNRIPPNNWLSAFKDSAWTWNENREQYYYHLFSPQQPDLNYRNERVVEEMKDILKYWLDFGIDGFRVGSVTALFEDAELKDEPLSNSTDFNENDYEYLDHIYTNHLDETFDMVYQWRELLNEYLANSGGDTKIMMIEAYGSTETILRYYGTPDNYSLGAHFSLNFGFIQNLNSTSTGYDVFDVIATWMDFEENITNSWMIGNHDHHRVASRLGEENIDAYNMILSILPGIQIIYNGEEIGQEDGEVTCEEGYDPSAIKNCSTFDQVSRDFERTPFQWDNSTNAGFNDGAKPWLPINTNYNEINLAAQNLPGIRSHYNTFIQSMELKEQMKHSEELIWAIGSQSNYILKIKRTFNGTSYGFYGNIGTAEESFFVGGSGNAEFLAVSWNSTHNVGDRMDLDSQIVLAPYESYLIKIHYD